MPLQRYSGVYEPADMDLMQRVFDRLCSERGLTDSEKREALAWEVVNAFQNGAADEAELLRTLSERRDR